MDIETIKLLGGGSAQLILAAVCIALTYGIWKLAEALVKSYGERLTELKATLQQRSEDNRTIVETLKDMKTTVDLALAALKGRS
jgi:hypothetical protein